MAGNGQRFIDAGFALPKPMINVCGKPMIERVIENLNIDAKYHFIVKKEHIDRYSIDLLLKSKVPDCNVISIDYKTEGAVCSALLAFDGGFIDPDSELIITNCDQIFEWNPEGFLQLARKNDGALLCHLDNHPKWSYCCGQKSSQNTMLVSSVVEKPQTAPINNFANVGFYYWKKAGVFRECCKAMIDKNDRVNGEFYIAPSYNYMLNPPKNKFTSKLTVSAMLCEKMHGLGTPEDLLKYEYQFNLD
jgi:NDP-sugar pyrophosphorylase family protein